MNEIEIKEFKEDIIGRLNDFTSSWIGNNKKMPNSFPLFLKYHEWKREFLAFLEMMENV